MLKLSLSQPSRFSSTKYKHIRVIMAIFQKGGLPEIPRHSDRFIATNVGSHVPHVRRPFPIIYGLCVGASLEAIVIV